MLWWIIQLFYICCEVLFPRLLLYCNCDKESTVTNRKSPAKWWLFHIEVYEWKSLTFTEMTEKLGLFGRWERIPGNRRRSKAIDVTISFCYLMAISCGKPPVEFDTKNIRGPDIYMNIPVNNVNDVFWPRGRELFAFVNSLCFCEVLLFRRTKCGTMRRRNVTVQSNNYILTLMLSF